MMFQRMLLVLCCLCLLAMVASAQELFSDQAVFGKDAASPLYNVDLKLQLAETASVEHGVQVALEWEKPQTYSLVTITRARITITAYHDDHATTTKGVDIALKPGTSCRLTIMRRDGWLGLLLNDALIFGGDFPRAPGSSVSLKAGQGWSVPEQSIQQLEPVSFSDDFMRVDNKFWATQHGQWFLQSAWDNDPKTRTMHLIDAPSAQNPFAYVGRVQAEGPAWCNATASKPYWEDYQMTAAVQPAPDGAVGMLVNMTGPDTGVLVRWTPAGDRATKGGSLSLCRMIDGKISVITESPGGFIPGQWFKISVTSSLLEGVQVAIDDHVRIPFTHTTLCRGGIGLYSESKTGAVFDDISAYGKRLNTDLLSERKLIQVSQRFQEDREMQAWAKMQSDWQPIPGGNDNWVHHFDYYGDHWVSATVTPLNTRSGQLVLTLNSTGQDANSGYRAVIKRSDDKTKFSYVIYRDAAELVPAQATDPCHTGEEYTFRFLREGNHLRLERDGQTVLEATDPQPLTGQRPAYHADGSFSLAHDIVVMGRNVLDYTFTSAPVDWLGEGTWEPSIRWSCAPQWSFLSGWSRGDAVLWHKQRFAGDQTFQAFIGIKMEYPRETEVYENRYHAIGVTICGDGKDPRNGYAVLFGAPDEHGNPNRRTVLMRNGVIVATAPQVMPPKDFGHHTWFDMTLQKHGDTIDFQVKYLWKNMWWGGDPGHEETVKLTFKDPQPLDGGIPAIWAPDNGITVARARIYYSAPPQPRTEPLIAMTEPVYPEWTNTGKPLTLDFPPLWSTDGKEAHLQVTPASVPAGEENSAVVKGAQVVFTPKTIGDHWYKICATEGQNRSLYTHLSIPVFNPALGRDDSHALVLYRFDEGTGAVVHDRSTVAPAADLVIPKDAQTSWLSGQGLAYTGPAPLKSAQGVPKLMAMQKSNAGTLEFWLSAATNDTPTDSRGCLLSWGEQGGGNKRNFTFTHVWYTPQLIGPDAYYYERQWQGPNWIAYYQDYQFCPRLQHVVIAWDGKNAHMYYDGKERTSNGDLSGLAKKWTADAPLLLGNIGDLSQNYIGTYYLVAVHDRCLTAAEVLRHYQAGPSAR